MVENKIGLIKSVSELLGMNFFIPAYQRGYRWDKQQVEDLLGDILTFKPTTEEEWYCLQPLVVKDMQDDAKKYGLSEEDCWYEVIDGQQRLTTIFLIIHYANQMWEGEDKIEEPKLRYETRKDSTAFLDEIKVENDSVKIDESNIDYNHISKAFSAIHAWVKAKKKQNFDKDSFKSTFQQKTKVIWYEPSASQDAIEIFTRINMGKIPLTNAELIKSVFLNSSNFKNDDTEKIRLKQLKIATEWDSIEYSLHNEEFWMFINKNENEKETRIEFIFELLVGTDRTNADEYDTFREYYKRFSENSLQSITTNWQEVKRYFQTLYNWFEDRELYHKIGFLITVGENVVNEFISLSFTKSKSDFLEAVDKKIRDKLVNIQLSQLEYGNGEVRTILLLHNIQTMLNNKNENSRFPFNRYKKEKWDIEHIHAIATEMPKDEKQQKDWLYQTKEFIGASETEILTRIANYSKATTETFEELFNDVLNYFAENEKHEDVNDLSNLVLLDAGTNRSYKNAVFPVKRKTIIDREKKGTFIPICTKNVFMKYYSLKIEQMTFWGIEDRNKYLDDIKTVLLSAKYLPCQQEQ
jgi:uncharacterized protein with ParB-like and HNH nuclease domain